MHDYTCLTCKNPFQSPKKDKKYCSHHCYASRHTKYMIKCVNCGADREVPYRWRTMKYCGTECQHAALKGVQKTPRVMKECEYCHEQYEIRETLVNTARFCSPKCTYAGLHGKTSDTVMLTCEGCKKEFEKPFTQRDRRFCSYKCSNSGENNGMYQRPDLCSWTGKHSWNHGLTSETDERVAQLGEKTSQIMSAKIVSGEWSPPVTKFQGSHFESVKCSKTFYCRSSYECKYLEKLETDPDVLSYEVEPLAIPYMFEGRVRNYIPDVMVTRAGKQQLVEVKPAVLTDTEQNVQKASAARNWCDQNGIEFLVITESELE